MFFRAWFVATLLLALAFMNPSWSSDPAFDCNKAMTRTETTICKSENLAALDRELTQKYRDFLDNLPNDKARAVAKSIQRQWIHTREAVCAEIENTNLGGGSKLDPSIDPTKLFYFEQYHRIEEYLSDSNHYSPTREECVAFYYRVALKSMASGFLKADHFFAYGKNNMRVNVGNIKTVVSKAMKDEPEGHNKERVAYAIKTRKNGAHPLGESQITYGKHTSVSGLRFYLYQDGTLTVARINKTSRWGGRCGHSKSISLGMFRPIESGLKWLTDSNYGDGITVRYSKNVCGGDDYSVSKIRAKNSAPEFEFVKNNNWYFWTKLPSSYSLYYSRTEGVYKKHKTRVTSLNDVRGRSAGEWVTMLRQENLLPRVRDSVSRISGSSGAHLVPGSVKIDRDAEGRPETNRIALEDWAAEKGERISPESQEPKKKKGNQCDQFYDGFGKYIRLKRRASRESISLQMAFDIVERVVSGKHIESARGFVPTAKVFLNYLDKARQVEDWSSKVRDVTNEFPEPNHHYMLLGEEPHGNPFEEAGFYTDSGCLSGGASPFSAASMEEWIYMFWGRRARDGNLQATEELLRRVVAHFEGESDAGALRPHLLRALNLVAVEAGLFKFGGRRFLAE